MNLEEVIKNLQKIAVEKDAKSTKIISTKDVFVENWVRQKCEYGCRDFARHFTCPPYSPTPEETRKRLRGYKRALLVEFFRSKQKQQNMHGVMYDLEREAFLSGLYKAFSYVAGSCRICANCPAEEVENPNEYSKRGCLYKKKARPSMEACGIDVYQTARKAGYNIDVVKDENECYRLFGLLLLE